MKTFVKELTLVLLLVVIVKPENDLETVVKKMQIDILDELNKLKIQNIKLEEKMKIADDKIQMVLTENNDLKREISTLRNPPYLHVCGGSKYNWIHSNSRIIDYTTLLYSSTNTEGGGLDIATGVFTSPWPGSYTVTWSLITRNYQGDREFGIFLRKNNQKVVESLYASEFSGQSGWAYEQGILRWFLCRRITFRILFVCAD